MMEWLGAYSKTVISFLLLQTLAQWVLPKGFEKQLQLLFGLGMVFTIASPLMAVLGADGQRVAEALDTFLEEAAWEGEVTVQEDALWETIYESNLSAWVQEETGAKQVDIIWQEGTEKTVEEVWLSGEGLSDASKKQVADGLGILPQQVTIQNEGGEKP